MQTEYAVKDLNEDPKLPFEDSSFDVITNAGVLCWVLQRAGLGLSVWFSGADLGLEGAPPTLHPMCFPPANCSVSGLPHPPPRGIPRDAPLPEAGGAGGHVFQQPLLPHQGHCDVDVHGWVGGWVGGRATAAALCFPVRLLASTADLYASSIR